MDGWQEEQQKMREEGSSVVRQEVRDTGPLPCAQNCEEALEMGLVPDPRELRVSRKMGQPL